MKLNAIDLAMICGAINKVGRPGRVILVTCQGDELAMQMHDADPEEYVTWGRSPCNTDRTIHFMTTALLLLILGQFTYLSGRTGA